MRVCNRLLFIAAFVAFAATFMPLNAGATDHIVDMQGISFIPQHITVKIGDKVTWTNSSAIAHTVTSGSGCVADGLFGSPLYNAGGTFSYTFTSMGTVPYYCIPHCFAGMTGTVTVDNTVATENATWGAIKKLYELEDAE